MPRLSLASAQLLERLEHVHRDQPPLQVLSILDDSHRVLLVISILEEGVVALTVPSGHLYCPDGSAVGHSADHSRVDKLHEVGIVATSATPYLVIASS